MTHVRIALLVAAIIAFVAYNLFDAFGCSRKLTFPEWERREWARRWARYTATMVTACVWAVAAMSVIAVFVSLCEWR